MKRLFVLLAACFACVVLQAQQLHWTPCDEGLYSGSTTVIAVVQVNGVEQASTQMELAVFSGTECRGTAFTTEFPITHRFQAMVNVYGEVGHELTFKAYDHANNEELLMDPVVTVLFTEDGSGTLFSPLELNFKRQIQNITFADANVKALCVANWDTNNDDELSYAEAAAVTDLGTVFRYNYNIVSFDELQYFTSLIEINADAFYGCSKLKSIKIPNSVTTIGSNAFRSNGLTSIEIPSSVETISYWAFADCSGLSSVEIPTWVTIVEGSAFSGCELEQLIVADGNPVYDSRDNCNAIIMTSTNQLVTGCPNTVIPSTVTSIGSYAFCNCKGLTLVYISSSITSIGYGAFQYNDLAQIVVDAENTIYDSRDNSNAIIETSTNKLIIGCKNTVIPNTVTTIGNEAFYSLNGLTTIDIPSSVTSIGYSAFCYCSNLASINVMATNPPALSGDYVFWEIDKSIPVTVYCESIGEYNSTAGWNEFVNYQTFEPCAQEITAVPSPTDGGTVSGAGIYNVGGTITLTATPNDGYIFVNWTKNDEIVSVNASYTFSVCASSEYVANFIIPDGLYLGEGEATSDNLPNNSSYNYSLTQQIFTAEEVGSGEISSIAFYNAGTEKTRNYTIYLKSTNKNVFTNDNDWIVVTESDAVFSGDVTMLHGQWTVIPFDSNFSFDGESNLALIIDDNTGLSHWNGLSCRVFAAEGNQTIIVRSFNNNCNPFDPSGYNGTRESVKNQIILGINHANSFTVSVSKDIEEAGTVTGGGIYDYGATCTVTAQANNGYTFRYWKDGDRVVSYDKEFTFTVKKAYNFIAVFSDDAPIQFADDNVKAICVENWDTNNDGELSFAEAAAVTDLGEVFKNNNTITSFDELQYFIGLTEIGNKAFYYCEKLASVVFPSTVTSIGVRAFYACEKLASAPLPPSVISINDYAFAFCYLLSSIEIPSTTTIINDYAFYYCRGVEQFVVAEGNAVYDSRDNCNALIYSETNRLMFGCKNTVIPNTVTFIGDNSFYACSGLTSIEIPNSVTIIGSSAFSNCNGLVSISISNSVSIIGSNAFYLCSALESLTIPSSVTSIGDNVIGDCRNLAQVSVDDGNTVFDSRDNCNAIIETASNKLRAGCKSTFIPNTVQIIGNKALYACYGISDMMIPNSVTEIEQYAFAFSYLTSVEIPSSVTTIGNNAFYYCNHLTQITSLAMIPPTLGNNAFSNVDHTIPVYVPRGATEAYQSASGWNEFTNIQENWDLPISFADANVKALCVANWDTNEDGELSYAEAAAVTDLGEVFKENYSIYHFDELQYFTGLTSIGYQAFAWCLYLSSIQLPNTITSIGNSAFFDCRNLQAITIPASVTNIGSSALVCENLEEIIVEAGNTVYDSRDNCNAVIKTSTNTLIRGCKNTVIPNTVVSLGSGAFQSCTMESVFIPASITNIYYDAFYACEYLAEITVSEDNPVYDSRDNCNAIIKTATNELVVGSRTTVIPNTVTSIGTYAFSYRFRWGSYDIIIPELVTSIGNNAYIGGYAVNSLTVLAEVPPTLGSGAFKYVPKGIPVYIPCGTVADYQAASGWSEFTNYQEVGCPSFEITASANPTEGGTVTGAGTYAQGTECTLTATANDGYTFVNWTENGTEVSTDATYSFTVSGGKNLVANFMAAIPVSTQTIELAAGTNWVSFNVDVTLDELKSALVATGSTDITIQGQRNNTRYTNGRWRGNLTYDVNMMFVVSVNAACEITLEGMPLDPAEHPITIAVGINWIGYPLNVSMTPADAFAGFAENGDVISSQGSNARYTGGRWRGTCDLVPGKGFIYQSTSDKTLVFPSSKIDVK